MSVITCEGCVFQHSKATCKRCLTCARNYSDKFQEPPPPKPLTHAEQVRAAQVLSLMGTLSAMAGDSYTTDMMMKEKHP